MIRSPAPVGLKEKIMAQGAEKDMGTHMNEVKWILVCGFVVVAFFVATEPVVPTAVRPIQLICDNQERLSPRNKIDCLIYGVTGRVLNPRVL
jgi:hypothetical protein